MSKYKCWYCKQEISDNEDIDIHKVNNVNRKFHLSKNCHSAFVYEKSKREKELEEKAKEEAEFKLLYDYVKVEILKYKEGMSLSKYAIGRLRGLRNGSFMKRKSQQSVDGYSYNTILVAFKLKKADIHKAIMLKEFTSEDRKFDYIMAIINNSINDVCNMMKKKEREKKAAESINFQFTTTTKQVEYSNKSKIKQDSIFDDMW